MYNAMLDKEENGIGKRLAAARKKKRMTAQELCDELAKFGISVSRPAYGKWERGDSIPTAYQLMAASFALDIDDPYYFSGIEKKPAVLNEQGLQKLEDYKADLIASGKYRPYRPTESKCKIIEMPVCRLRASAGTGSFLDEGGFENISVIAAQVPAGADWILADAIGAEAIHREAWDFVQGPLRDSLSNPEGAASGDIAETEKLCSGLVMSGFAMQAMNSSRPASGTEHQFSHYWDMEDLCYNGLPVSHGFKVGIGTLASTAIIEFLLEQDLTKLDVEATVAKWWPTFEALKATFPQVYGDRPAHIARAESEMALKYPTPEALRKELTFLKANWTNLRAKMAAQIMSFGEVREALKTVGAPYEPEMIGVSRAKFRETFSGIPYMRNRYFSLDLVSRLGLLPNLLDRLFGAGGVWQI